MIDLVADPRQVQATSLAARARGQRVGFVPTMGALHDGHLSLMELARPLCDRLVVSIYVNPLQFGPNEDLDRYPRDLDGDVARCASVEVDEVFAPTDLYDADHATTVHVEGLTKRLCGADRPGHFDGVTTVVSRLFGVVQPHLAVFGEKDFQQLQVIRRMVRDLAMAIEIVPGPLVRDPDGLAMSSRNLRLSPADRQRALSLHRALRAMRDSLDPVALARLQLGRSLLDVDRLDYLEIVDPHSLEPLDRIDRPARALVAAHVGDVRLIDNLAL